MKKKYKKKHIWILLLVILLAFFFVMRLLKISEPVQQVSQISQEKVEEIKNTPEWQIELTPVQVVSLYDMYKRDKDIKIASSLLQYYIAIGNYVSWYALLLDIEKNDQVKDMYAPTMWFIVFNYAVDQWTDWKEIDFERRNVDADTKSFHDSLTYVIRTDFSWFESQLRELEKTNVLYKNVIKTFLTSLHTFSSLKEPPVYYKEWLIAATLMEAWYYPLAWLVANNILRVDKKYILSYEILSQKSLKQKDYWSAIKYLNILFGLDRQHISRTAFYLWKAYYRQWEYSNALLYLNQAVQKEYIYDAARYIILTNYKLGNTEKVMEWFRFLLTEQKLTPNDYLLLYDIVFFEPYVVMSNQTWDAQNKPKTIAQEYALKIILPFIDSCRKKIAKNHSYVCKYGEAWRYLSQNKPDKALRDLLYLTKTYPHPTVFKALWDYYALQWDADKAQQYFVKSLITSADTYQNTSIYSWNSIPK